MELRQYINEHITYMDGPMGTCLQSRGLPAGVRPESWNIDNPEAVIDMHRDFFEAGSNLVCANTFGANGIHFPDEGQLKAIIEAGVAHVREARRRSGCQQMTWIGLKMSSLGRLLEPLGDMSFDEAVSHFAKVVCLGRDAGVDFIDIETMNDSYETKAALLAAKENCDLPVFVSNTYDETGRLMTGASPEAMVAMLEGMGADAVGINCSLGPEKLLPIADRYLAAASVPVFFRPNAGLPKLEGGRTVYDVDPEAWADLTAEAVRRGVRMAGGCCGTDARYTRALIERTKTLPVVPITKKTLSCVSSYTHTVSFGDMPVLMAERINPNALDTMRRAIHDGDLNALKAEAIRQRDEGAHLIDVNVGLPEIDEPAFLQKAVQAIQSVVNNPLVIDTSDPAAMEAALRHYNGKALIDSVNGKEENMKAIFPLAKKYGGMIVCLTIDEEGIPKTADKRIAIAKKIIAGAEAFGIDRKELIFDALVMTISTDSQAAAETLKAVKAIHDMGCLTSLGVSNVSFGLPRRPVLNGAFFLMALCHGLDAGIVNTGSAELMNAYYSYCALKGRDASCLNYLKHCASLDSETAQPDSGKAETAEDAPAADGSAEDPAVYEALRAAIIDGMEDEAAEETARLLESVDPFALIGDAVIPALDYVGKGFEEGDFFLPELLMSAETAESVCGIVKDALKSGGSKGASRCRVVLATVRGDVHDIGKNIVRILLENYGFEVIDLGTDVPAEVIVDKVTETQAPICGLSALMTTSVPAMEETIKLLAEKATFCKVIVGGAVLNEEYAERIHAHYYAPAAMATVRIAEAIDAAL